MVRVSAIHNSQELTSLLWMTVFGADITNQPQTDRNSIKTVCAVRNQSII